MEGVERVVSAVCVRCGCTDPLTAAARRGGRWRELVRVVVAARHTHTPRERDSERQVESGGW